MRVSDWISDVCSSDLDRLLSFHRLGKCGRFVDLQPHPQPQSDQHGRNEEGDAPPPRRELGIAQPQAEQQEQPVRSEEHTSELQSLMRNSSAVFCLKKKNNSIQKQVRKKTSYIYLHKSNVNTTYSHNQ